MHDPRRYARKAGLLYLAIAIIAPFSLSYVPGQLAAAGGVSAATLVAHAPLVRLGFASELIYQTIEIFIALALYEMFRPTNRRLALQMLALGLLPVPIVFLNQAFGQGALMLAAEPQLAAGFDGPSRDTAVLFLMNSQRLGLVIAGIFWGLWLFPLGWLIIRCDFLPTLLGWSVILGGTGYVIRAFAVLCLPGQVSPAMLEGLKQIADVLVLGEVPVIFGLLWLGFSRTRFALSRQGNA